MTASYQILYQETCFISTTYILSAADITTLYRYQKVTIDTISFCVFFEETTKGLLMR